MPTARLTLPASCKEPLSLGVNLLHASLVEVIRVTKGLAQPAKRQKIAHINPIDNLALAKLLVTVLSLG